MKELIIVTKKWGRNFTGATLATQYFAEKWLNHFDHVSVYTLQQGESLCNNALSVYAFKNEYSLFRRLSKDIKHRKINAELTCYSDDHLGFIFSLVHLPYFHTYHGNWPDAKNINCEFYLKSFYFIPLYIWTIKRAACVINVSQYMEEFTSKYNPNTAVIRNGIDCKTAINASSLPSHFLMVGNIDQRKYGYLLSVLEMLKSFNSDIKIDIYGKTLDQRIANKLRVFPNICLRGLVKDIPYKQYLGLINTSRIENLSISVCEAINNRIPVFCFDVGGLPEVVKTEKTGFVFSDFNAHAMAEALHVYRNSESRMEVDATILSDFDWDTAANKYLDMFSIQHNDAEVY